MKVRVTTTMARTLNKAMPNYKVSLERFNPDQYKMMVDYDLFRNERDFDFENNEMKAIRVGYPDNYYAMPKYLTTRDLERCFRCSDKTIDGFLSQVKAECEV